MLTYTAIALITLSYFGTEQIQPSIFDNLKDDKSASSIMLQAVFLLIFFCNIPFIFFAGKASLLSLVQQLYKKMDWLAPPKQSETLTEDHNDDALSGDFKLNTDYGEEFRLNADGPGEQQQSGADCEA